jgi:tape measure domain-containing protein
MANKINVALTLETSGFQRSLQMAEKSLARFGRQMANAGETLTQSLTAPLGGLGLAAVKSFADMEKLNKGLTAIMGSSEMAAEELQKLREVAKLPGLGLKEAVQGSINLQAVGLSADEARSTLFGFGKALAAVGKGKFELEAIQYQLTQMISKNKLLAEDYKVIQSNLPLMAAGMEAAFGTNNIEAIRDTGISAKEFTLRLSEALAKLPQTQNVTGGLANAFENFSDNVFIAASELGGIIAEALDLEGIMTKLSDSLQSAVSWFKQLSPGVQKAIVVFAAILAGIGPVIFIVGKLASSVAYLITAFKSLISIGPKIAAAWAFITGPIGLTIAAIAGVIAVLVILYKRFEVVRQVINGVGSGFIELGKAAKAVFGNILEGFQNIREGNFTEAAKNLKDAFVGAQPFELGKSFVQGFAKGFEDNTDYLTPAIKKIQAETKKITSSIVGGTSFGTFEPTAGTGGGKIEAPKIDTKALLEQEKAISNITSRIAGLAQTAKGPFGFVRAELSNITVLTPELNKQKDALLEYQKALLQVSNQAAIFGENPLEAQLGATETALKSALETFGPYSEAVRVLADEYDRLKVVIEENDEATLKAKEQQMQYAEIAATLFDTLGSSLAASIGSLESFGKAAKRAFLDVFGTIINEIVLLQIRNFLASPAGAALGPIGGAIALGAGKAFGSVLKALFGTVKLAKGGLAFGPTLATVGDNPGARTDPEVIAPLSKLREYLDGGSGSMIAETRISGNDLLVLVRRAETRDGRIR